MGGIKYNFKQTKCHKLQNASTQRRLPQRHPNHPNHPNHPSASPQPRPPPTKAGGSCCVIYLEQATIKFVKVKSFPATTLSASTFCLHVAVIHSLHLLSIPLKIPLHSAWPIPLSHIAAARPTGDPAGGGGGSLGRGGQGVTWTCCCGRRKLYFYDTKQTINSSG